MENNTGILLARVYDKKLYAAEVDKIIPENSSAEDSILMANAYIERWIKESLIMHEAEINIPSDLEIDKLVDDYRASLILNQFEKSLVDHLLDTIIDEGELVAYYDENKASYLLESIIVRCRFIQVPKSIDKKIHKQIQENWKREDPEELVKLENICQKQAVSYLLNDSAWYKLDIIQSEMPRGSINEAVIRHNKEFQLTNDDYYYFLKILEIKDEKEIAPLNYIESQASKVILHKRKIELLAKLRDDLYERAAARNQIKLFTE
jgi:hypothetical protein